MSFSDAEIRMLSAADNSRGWSPIPDGTPAKFVQKICEIRARQIGYTPSPVPTNAEAAADAARRQRAIKQLAACLLDSE